MKLKNHQPPGVQAPREVSNPGFPDKSFLGLLYSSKGTGKTNTLINIVKEYDKTRFFQKVYLFSPSVHNDPKYDLLRGGSYELRVYPEYSDEILREVIEEIREDIRRWREWLRLEKLYKKSQRALSPDMFNDDELLDLFLLNWEQPKQPFDREPYSLVVFDDLASNKELMKQGKSVMSSFALLHRHVLTSILFSVQLFKNAVPRMIRNNLDWYVLGANKSRAVMREVAEELNSYASEDELITMWEKATEEPFSYFTINLMKPAYRFRRNFDEDM